MICTEGINASDVCAYNGTTLVEIEVKISKSDFKKEFKTVVKRDNYWKVYKHERYANPHSHILNGFIVPNKYYFCVPAELSQWAKEFLDDKNTKYGLLSYDLNNVTGHTHIITIKPARSLHKEEQDRMRIALEISRRTVNEIITAKEQVIKYDKELSAIRKGIIEEEQCKN